MRRLLLVALVLLAGCPASNSEPAAVAPVALEVAVARPARADVAHSIVLPVELLPWQEVALVAKVAGYLAEVSVDRGSRVREGDVLARIALPELEDEKRKREADVKVASSEITSARAQRELEQITYDRLKALVVERAISQQDLDVAKGKLDVAAAHVLEAEARLVAANDLLRSTETWLAYGTLRAPFTGVIVSREVHTGAFVSDHTLLFRMCDASTIRAAVDVPEVDAPAIVTSRTRAVVLIPELGRPREGLVARSATALDRHTRTLRVEIDLPNEDGHLLPGMYGHATLTLDVHKDVLTVPESAISQGAVFVIRDGRAKRLPVTTGYDDGSRVEVHEALAEPVITPARGIADGALVVSRP